MVNLVDLEPADLHPSVLALLAVVALVGIVGNVLIIGTVLCSRRLRTVGNAFIINLAVADLVVTAFIMPIGIVTTQFGGMYPFNPAFCSASGFLLFLTLGGSTQTLMVIAVERYVHICHPAWYRRVFTPRLAGLYIVLVWAHSAGWACQGFTGLLEYTYFPAIYLCAMRLTHPVFNVCVAAIGMLVPVVVMAFSYAAIFYTVRKSRATVFKRKRTDSAASTECLTQSQKKLRGERRFILTLFIIVVVFLVSWTPSALVMSVFSHDTSLSGLIFLLCVWLALSNSSVNALIYGAMNKNFRRGYRHLALSMVCCRQAAAGAVCCQCAGAEEVSNSTSQSKLPGANDAHQMASQNSNDDADAVSNRTVSFLCTSSSLTLSPTEENVRSPDFDYRNDINHLAEDRLHRHSNAHNTISQLPDVEQPSEDNIGILDACEALPCVETINRSAVFDVDKEAITSTPSKQGPPFSSVDHIPLQETHL